MLMRNLTLQIIDITTCHFADSFFVGLGLHQTNHSFCPLT